MKNARHPRYARHRSQECQYVTTCEQTFEVLRPSHTPLTLGPRGRLPNSTTGERRSNWHKYEALPRASSTLKLAQHLIATRYGRIQGALGSLLSGQRPLDLLGPDITQLHHVAQAEAARVLGRLL